MTYNQLLTYAPLALFARNRDTVDQMPDIVRRAQDYVVLRVDHDLFKQALPAASVDTTGMIFDGAVPQGLLEYRSVSVEMVPGRRLPLRRRAEEMLEALFSGHVGYGQPQYYTMTDSRAIRVYPAPSRLVSAYVIANIRPPALGPTVQTNVLMTEFPDLMELATAMEAASFNLDQPAAAMYQQKLQDALLAANNQISRRTRDEGAQRPLETRNVTGV